MKYSIIVPVFNRPDEVDELLESLTHQIGERLRGCHRRGWLTDSLRGGVQAIRTHDGYTLLL